MAGDTDLDLALAIALAEASDGYSDDDFKHSRKQLELRQQSLFAKCRNRPPTKSKKTASQTNKRQKTQVRPVAAESLQGKDNGASKRKQTAGQNQHKNGAKDPKNSAVIVEGVGMCKNSDQPNMFDSFRYQAPRCEDICKTGSGLEDGRVSTIYENSPSSLEKIEDDDLILTTNIASPEARQTGLHDVHDLERDVSVVTAVEEHFIEEHPIPSVEDHLEEIVSLDQEESQFSALLRLCSEQAAVKEYRIEAPDASVAEPGSELHGFGRTGQHLEDLARLRLDGTTSVHAGDLDDSIDDISCLMTQHGVPKPAESESCVEEWIPALQDMTDRGKAAEDDERTKLEADRENVNIICPICEDDLSEISLELRMKHTEVCLNKMDDPQDCQSEGTTLEATPIIRDTSISFGCEKVKQWLEGLNLQRYIDTFNQHEIDWDTLQWLTDEDLQLIGVTCLGPRRKVLGALQELKRVGDGKTTESTALPAVRVEDGNSTRSAQTRRSRVEDDVSGNVQILGGRVDDDIFRNVEITGSRVDDEISRSMQTRVKDAVKLITNFFPVTSVTGEKRVTDLAKQQEILSKQKRTSRVTTNRPRISHRTNIRGVPAWMCIPGTPFRVDAFQYLSGDCSHWFLTHFHTDHYHGLTRGFRYGRIFCSSITARLVNLKIGVSWDRLMIVPMNEKFKICGVDVTFIDANHCPGSVMIIFEPPNGEAILHTGDFRFCSAMADNSSLLSTRVHTLILDTTYCDRQYDFPKQESVIQFVIDAIQAESFNRETLFLIGTYTIGKERIFLEVGKVLRKKIYVGSAKMKLLECMDLSAEDTKWLTCNDQESFIHVVPLWSISSFKRMNSISRHYHGRYKLIVAFSPTGWSFGRGKKKTPGKRHQQGTMIRYEVPYSEHSSFFCGAKTTKSYNPLTTCSRDCHGPVKKTRPEEPDGLTKR
ncbi:hypothetical protein R1flu_020954 [Riccia fluitans]|uniref:SAM domain-containing protein n=1 Tax=Riccia fluitans TaxID=41844 RepID=A0ABD1ZPL2_9MARC